MNDLIVPWISRTLIHPSCVHVSKDWQIRGILSVVVVVCCICWGKIRHLALPLHTQVLYCSNVNVSNKEWVLLATIEDDQQQQQSLLESAEADMAPNLHRAKETAMRMQEA